MPSRRPNKNIRRPFFRAATIITSKNKYPETLPKYKTVLKKEEILLKRNLKENKKDQIIAAKIIARKKKKN